MTFFGDAIFIAEFKAFLIQNRPFFRPQQQQNRSFIKSLSTEAERPYFSVANRYYSISVSTSFLANRF